MNAFGRTSHHSGWVRFAVVALASALAACGGGGGGGDDGGSGGIGPLWIETGVTAADLDGDRRTDVVTVASLARGFGDSDGYLRIYRQQVSGTFAIDEHLVGRYPWRVEASDIDGDGRPDLLVLDVIGGSGTNDDVLYLLLQDRLNPGRYLAPRAIATGLAAYDFSVSDLNRDGAPDIVIAGSPGGSTGAQWLMQDPGRRGSFHALAPLDLPGRASRVATGDLDGDGWIDLAFYATTGFSTSTGSSGQVALVPGQAAGFGAANTLAPQTGLNAELIRVADVDGNGLSDVLVVFNPFSSDYRAKITVLMQTGAGQFNPIDTSLAGLGGTMGFVVADLNGDGRPEVATTGFYPDGSQWRSHTNVLLQTGGGAYSVAASHEMPAMMSRVTAADLDGDGLNDLLLLGGQNRAFVMLQSRTTPGTFAVPRAL